MVKASAIVLNSKVELRMISSAKVVIELQI
jgi:hypothetical protein